MIISETINPILQWLNMHPHLAGIVTFLISASESVAIIGTIIPGSIMMTAIGALAGAGIIPLWSTIIWAILGAIVGDGISYWIGYYFKDQLLFMWPFRQYPSILESGERFVHKYGGMSIFIGRFVGPVRALVPLVAGMLGMRPLSFTLFNIASAIGWAPLYMLPGLLLGAAALELPPDIAIHVVIVLLLLTLSILLCLWLIREFILLIRQQIMSCLTTIWRTLQQSHYFNGLTILLQYYNPAQSYGQLPLAFYTLSYSTLFSILAYHVFAHTSAHLAINNTIYYLFRGLRHQSVDPLMIGLTLLGEKTVMLPAIIAISLWLSLRRAFRAAAHFLTLGLLAGGSVFMIKHLIHSERPLGILQNINSFSLHDYSMPSGHTTLVSIGLLGIAFFINIAISKQLYRRLINSTAILFILGTSISRLYLGAHWFSDVLGGWLLSGALLSIIILSYRRKPPELISPLQLCIVSILALTCSYAYTFHQKGEALSARYTVINLARQNIPFEAWWQEKKLLNTYRTNLFGFPSQWINLEWIASLNAIQTTLTHEGWVVPPKRDWLSILYRLTGGAQSTKYIALISPRYLDKKPSLIFMRLLDDKKTLLVLRLWDANVNVTDPPICCLWVGVMSKETSTYSWIYKKHPAQVTISPQLLFAHFQQTPWQWKLTMNDNVTAMHPLIGKQPILFIKPILP